MFFRVYMLIAVASFITFLTTFCTMSAMGILFTVVWLFEYTSKYNKWRKAQMGTEKSLSFGIKSMRRQKQNFKLIIVIFARYPDLQKFFKRASIIFDDMHIKIKYGNKVDSIQPPISGSEDDYRYHPLYKSSSSNIYHRKD